MTSRDLVISALNHDRVDRAPRDLWVSPLVKTTCADDVAEIEVRFPNDVIRPDFQYPAGKRSKGRPSRVGQYTDAWGCTWHVAQRGSAGEAQNPLLDGVAKMADYRPPLEILDRAKFAKVNRSCAATSRFVAVRTECRPFERLQALRGTPASLTDLKRGSKRIRDMMAMLHDFYCRELELWAETDVDGVMLGDDWGSEDALLIAPEIWRDMFRPLYRDYCDILHAKDKFVFFQSGGMISDIFPDLVKMDVDAIRSHLFLMKIERLAKRFRGRVTFWGEIDGRQTLPSGTPDEIREAVLRVRRALDFGSGGLIAQCEWGPDIPIDNIAAVFEHWMAPLPMHAA